MSDAFPVEPGEPITAEDLALAISRLKAADAWPGARDSLLDAIRYGVGVNHLRAVQRAIVPAPGSPESVTQGVGVATEREKIARARSAHPFCEKDCPCRPAFLGLDGRSKEIWLHMPAISARGQGNGSRARAGAGR